MKRIILLGLLGISISPIVKSQTTWDEYNYITHQFKAYVQEGSTIKQGYKANAIRSETITFGKEYVKVWLTALHRSSTNKIAAYVLSYQLEDKTNNMEYYCIPHPNSDQEILNTYLKSLYSDNKYTITKLQCLLYVVSLGLKW